MPALLSTPHSLAIAMWDFSWLERRWEGGGYEDWSAALDGLVARGYDVVRIDAYPHLIWDGAERYTLKPVWDQHPWGSPHPIDVDPSSDLLEFIALAREKGLLVSLSSWYREDSADVRRRLRTPEDLASVWLATLAHIESAGLLDAVWFVDLGNEWPQPMWAPFLYQQGDDAASLDRTSAEYQRWTDTALGIVAARYPAMPLCFSFIDQMDTWARQDVSAFGLLELHIWMVQGEDPSFYESLGYDIVAASFDPDQYQVLTAAPALYRSDPELWRKQLDAAIDRAAQWSKAASLPLVTTESWATICWKDGEGLDWEWVKELCEHGVRRALETGRWAALSTSNFCGPQFRGMWDDTEWHQALTRAIHSVTPEI
ncbi:cellulase-like family protein [Microbacterium invictum]|uniref:Cellulase-like family protein n=1 Tax=Microbacterium invictum TaxID=515415 RepID=A0ABZ0VBR8_9MICO|nr:cellulase-like family protein [Microbacterium invictum]WQB70674.1 cellulase-like family protein [Microbacterium invictum]